MKMLYDFNRKREKDLLIMELASLKSLTINEKESLKKMINSENQEDYDLGKLIIDTCIVKHYENELAKMSKM